MLILKEIRNREDLIKRDWKNTKTSFKKDQNFTKNLFENISKQSVKQTYKGGR